MLKNQVKAQTSLEFLIIVLALLLIAMSATLFLVSTFDNNIGIYKVKNKTISFLANHNAPLTIQLISYSYTETDVNFNVVFKKANTQIPCPTTADFNYHSVEQEIKRHTKYSNVKVNLFCS